MRFGVSIPNMGDPAALVEVAVDAERAGWDGVFLWDHLHFVRAMRNDVHDPWVVLGAMAVRTERVRLGTLVTPVARRRPWVLAKEVVTLDHLSGGRAVLGVGLGEPGDEEFAAFGDPADARVRAERLDEGLAVVAGIWTGGAFRHEGRHYTVDCELLPPPVQQPRPPVWVAGMWPHRRPMDRARRWDGVVPLDRDDGPLGPDGIAEVVAYLGPVADDFAVVATARDGVPAGEYAAAGATWLVTSCWPVGDWRHDLERAVRAGPPR